MKIDVCLTPGQYSDKLYSSWVAVVIDVFRATSSMAAAFANQCKTIIPVETIEAALDMQSSCTGALLAGERNALKIKGFDLGNSPLEFKPEVVNGKTIVMSTTNGTVALVKASQSTAVLTASFVNAAAVCRKLHELNNDIVLVCAGRKGEFSLEDALCAGLLADRLADSSELCDAAQFARSAYIETKPQLLLRVAQSLHAQYLYEVGLGDDVAWCLQHDILDVAPCYRDGLIQINNS